MHMWVRTEELAEVSKSLLDGRYGAAKMEELTQNQKISGRGSLGVRKRVFSDEVTIRAEG
jgi:hypothetical protein